ncbi:MAG: glycerol kinase, partial [Solobacterium sp.]|nr:glycerol kinase [Solobacterium sp.]
MQLQSDLLGIPVRVPQIEELSGFGAAFAAGLALGVYDMKLFEHFASAVYTPQMDPAAVKEKYDGWLDAVRRVR